MKPVELDLFFVREKVSHDVVQVNHAPGLDQVVDVFTRPLTEIFVYIFVKNRQYAPYLKL